MRKITLFIVLAFCLSLVGCSKDAEVNSFITEFDTVNNEIVQKINAGDIDGAKATFDGKKESLKSKWAAVKDARGSQISEDSRKKLEESMKRNAETLGTAAVSTMLKLGTDNPQSDKVAAIVKEFGEIFKM